MESNDLYLMQMTAADDIKFYDLFPTPADVIKNLKIKFIKVPKEHNCEGWKSSEIKLFKTSKEKIHEDFDEIFGEPEVIDDCACWFDISVGDLEKSIIKELDLLTFVFENSNI